ncbi:MAG: tetratricopeptide repeat protein [Flavobacteriales bacterium]|nr:tetratricopeptide repeat protein [Flavobacteriales bacterium]
MNRAKAIQLILIAGTLALFAFIFAAPKNYSEKKLEDKARNEIRKDLDNQLVEIKKSLKPEASQKVERLEKQLSEAKSNAEKSIVLDSLVLFWDLQNYPGASVLYIEEKAALLNTAELWIQTGDRYLSMSDFGDAENKPYRLDKAEDAYRNALDVDNTNLTAKTGLGTVLVRKQANPMEGIALLREVVEKDPKNIRALLQLADFSIMSNQPEKALERFDQVLAADPSFYDVYFFKAETYAKMGNKEKAWEFLLLYQEKAENEEASKEAENYLKINYGI